VARGLVDEHRLTDEHRQAILAAIPARVKAKANWPELEQKALADLDEIVAGYHVCAQTAHLSSIPSLSLYSLLLPID